MGMVLKSILESELLSLVDVDEKNGCWLFKGLKDLQGYGKMVVDGIQYYSHRYFYESFKNQIQPVLMIDQFCRIKQSCNPNELKVLPQSVNLGIINKLNFQRSVSFENEIKGSLSDDMANQNYKGFKKQSKCLICKSSHILPKIDFEVTC